MEISKEVIESAKLNEEQVTAINAYTKSQFTELETKYSGKANEQAEGILTGAIKTIQELTGVERQNGQKIADYVKTAGETYLSKERERLASKISEYEEKVKGFKGNESLSTELEKAKTDLLAYKKQAADLEPLKGLDEKYNALLSQSKKMKEDNAFSMVKPSVPTHLSDAEKKLFNYEYEAWKKQITGKYDIVYVDGEYKAQSKENELIIKDLEALFKENTDIMTLLKPREQRGVNSKAASEMLSADGVPFKIPKEATTKELVAIIEEHLAQKGMNKLSKEYPIKFAELLKNSKLAQSK